MGGGGSSTNIETVPPEQQKKTIGTFYGFQENQLSKFIKGDPLLSALYSSAGAYINPVLASGGALTPDEARFASQSARAAASASGTIHDPSAIVNEVLNRQSAKDTRYGTAFSRAGQLFGTAVSGFTSLQNPILAYLSSMFGQNLQAQIAQAQIGAQQQAAGKAGTSSAIGGGLSAVGSIAGAAL